MSREIEAKIAALPEQFKNLAREVAKEGKENPPQDMGFFGKMWFTLKNAFVPAATTAVVSGAARAGMVYGFDALGTKGGIDFQRVIGTKASAAEEKAASSKAEDIAAAYKESIKKATGKTDLTPEQEKEMKTLQEKVALPPAPNVNDVALTSSIGFGAISGLISFAFNGFGLFSKANQVQDAKKKIYAYLYSDSPAAPQRAQRGGDTEELRPSATPSVAREQEASRGWFG